MSEFGSGAMRESVDNGERRRFDGDSPCMPSEAELMADPAAGTTRHTPQRSAAVCTGASHSANEAASTALTVTEQPAISSEVTYEPVR